MKVFAKRSHRFNPASYPFVGFKFSENRDALVAASSPGDRLVLVGAQDAATEVEDRGRLLGMIEFGHVPIDLDDSAVRATINPTLPWAVESQARPKALPILRAWSFDRPRLKLIDVLKEQLAFEAISKVVTLDDADSRIVLTLPRTEVRINPPSELARLRHHAFPPAGPTVGPAPTDWVGTISHAPQGEAWTYALKFGMRPVWKIGWSQDTEARLEEINRHVPFEVTGERWCLRLRQRWESAEAAYEMEQRVLYALRSRRTKGERVICEAAELMSAWDKHAST